MKKRILTLCVLSISILIGLNSTNIIGNEKDGNEILEATDKSEDVMLEKETTKRQVLEASDKTTLQETQFNDKVTITLVLNGGQMSKTEIVQDIGEKLIIDETPSKEGFVFYGWFYDEGLSETWRYWDNVNNDITLYAGWSEAIDVNQFSSDMIRYIEQNFGEVQTVSLKHLEGVNYFRTYMETNDFDEELGCPIQSELVVKDFKGIQYFKNIDSFDIMLDPSKSLDKESLSYLSQLEKVDKLLFSSKIPCGDHGVGIGEIYTSRFLTDKNNVQELESQLIAYISSFNLKVNEEYNQSQIVLDYTIELLDHSFLEKLDIDTSALHIYIPSPNFPRLLFVKPTKVIRDNKVYYKISFDNPVVLAYFNENNHFEIDRNRKYTIEYAEIYLDLYWDNMTEEELSIRNEPLIVEYQEINGNKGTTMSNEYPGLTEYDSMSIYMSEAQYKMALNKVNNQDKEFLTINYPGNVMRAEAALDIPSEEMQAGGGKLPNNNFYRYQKYGIAFDLLNEYKVDFETVGGSSVDSQEVFDGDNAVLPVEPTKEGYVFNGWYTSETYETLFDFNHPIKSDTTVYAKWDVRDVVKPVEPVEPSTPVDPTTPNTGINSQVLSLFLMGSMAACVAIVVGRKKLKR